MDAERSTNKLTHRPTPPTANASIDAELQRALSIEPSPEFLARVRTQVVHEQLGSAWGFTWKAVAAGGFAIVMIAALVVIQPELFMEAPDLKVGPTYETSEDTGRPRRDVGATFTSGAQNSPMAVALARRPSVGPRRDPDVPEVIISKEDADAMRWFLAAIAKGEIDPARFAELEVAAASPEIQEITIEPLVIQPLDDIEPLVSIAQ